jgi:hypothetical protein
VIHSPFHIHSAASSSSSSGPSLLLSLDKGRYTDWPALRDWLLALHVQQARRGITNTNTSTSTSTSTSIGGEEKEDAADDEAGAFRRFLATLPPALASLITPLSGAGAVLGDGGAVDGGNGNGDGNGNILSPRAALRRLVAAIEVGTEEGQRGSLPRLCRWI